MQFSPGSLQARRAASIAVLSRDLLRHARGIDVVESALRSGQVRAVDSSFLASVSAAASSGTATGPTSAHVLADLLAAVAALAPGTESALHVVLAPAVCQHLAFMGASVPVFGLDDSSPPGMAVVQAGGGTRAFAELSPTGGTLCGLPCRASDEAPDDFTLIDAAGYAGVAEDVQLRRSEHAAIHMVTQSGMDTSPPTPADVVSMFQTNSVAVMAERQFGFAALRPSAVGRQDLIRHLGAVMMDVRARLDQLAASIRRRTAIGQDAARERQEAGRIIRSFIPDDAERRTALHEAGHATVMHLVGVRCRSATVEGRAHAQFQERGSPRERALAAVAGSLAEDGTIDHMSEADRAILQKASESLAPRGSSVADVVDGIVREARRLISEHHDAIMDVAEHMSAHGKSFGYEIGSTVERSMRTRHAPRRTSAPAQPGRRYAEGETAVGLGRVRPVFQALRDTETPPALGSPRDWQLIGRVRT